MQKALKKHKKSIFEGQVTQQPSAIGSVQAVSFSALACNKFKIFMHLLILKGLKTVYTFSTPL